MSVRAIFNQSEIVTARNLHKAVHGSRIPPQVHDAYCAGTRGDTALHIIWVGEQCFRIHVAEDRAPSALQDWSRGGKESVAGHDDLCARLDSKRKVGAVKRCSAAVHRQRVPAARKLCELPLETGDRTLALSFCVDIVAARGQNRFEVGGPHLAPALFIFSIDSTGAAKDS